MNIKRFKSEIFSVLYVTSMYLYITNLHLRSGFKFSFKMKVPKEAVRKQIITLIPVYVNLLMLGCSLGWMSNAIYFFLLGEEVKATYSQCALVAGFFEFGKVTFAIPSGMLVDKFGRKTITISVAVIHFLAWLTISCSSSIIMIYTGRFIDGLATALLDATTPTVLGEIASPEIRGQLSGINRICMALGMIIPSTLNGIFHSYKYLSWGITILSVISLLPMFWMTETPSYLISVSKSEKAKNALRRIRPGYQENEVNDEFEKLNLYIREEKIRKKQFGWMQFIKNKSIRKPLIIGTLLNSLASLSGVGITTNDYITVIFPPNEYIPVKFYPLISQILSILLIISTPFYIDKFPRRTIFLFGAVIRTAANAVCAIAEYFVEYQNSSFFQGIFILGNIISSIFSLTTTMSVLHAIRSEIYPHAVKGFGASLGVLSQSLSTAILHQLFMFFKGHCSLYVMYVIFAISAFFLFLEVKYVLPESGGVNLADIQMKFKEKPMSNTQNERQDIDVEKILS